MSTEKKIQKGAVFCALCGLFLTAITVIAPKSHSRADSADSGLINYYLNSARVFHETADLKRYSGPFSILALIRKFTLDSNADTLRLDTAIVRAFYPPLGASELERQNIAPDSVLTLRDSYTEGRPELTSLIKPLPWERSGAFRLYPDDPTDSGQAIEYVRDSSGTGVNDAPETELFVIDKGTGALLFDLTYDEDDSGRKRISRETEFTLSQGFLVPQAITEHVTLRSIWGSKYFVVETKILSLRLR